MHRAAHPHAVINKVVKETHGRGLRTVTQYKQTRVLGPSGLAVRSDLSLFPPVLLALGVSWIPRVPSGPSVISLNFPACPPLPLVLVSRGSYSSSMM
jgi:hypothetical protein